MQTVHVLGNDTVQPSQAVQFRNGIMGGVRLRATGEMPFPKHPPVFPPGFSVTDKPLIGANVYLEGTSVFTSTDEEGYFKFNIVDVVEYRNGNENLFMKEAGCQTSYTPYPISNVILFLSQLFPIINDIITNRLKESNSYTWFGSREVLLGKNVKISSYGGSHHQGELIRNECNGN